MNFSELTDIINYEDEALKELLSLLDEQYKLIMRNSAFELDAIVDKIKECNVKIAEKEVERRRLIGDKSMKVIVRESNYSPLDKAFRSINGTLFLVKQQKDTNELLLKQQIVLNNQTLNIINPRREMKTYNSYGNLRR